MSVWYYVGCMSVWLWNEFVRSDKKKQSFFEIRHRTWPPPGHPGQNESLCTWYGNLQLLSLHRKKCTQSRIAAQSAPPGTPPPKKRSLLPS